MTGQALITGKFKRWVEFYWQENFCDMLEVIIKIIE